MANQRESIDLICEKQELDIFLSDIAAIGFPDKVEQKKTIADVEDDKLQVSDQHESFDLVREKQETDFFLSRIAARRIPDGLIQEKAVATVGKEEKKAVTDSTTENKEQISTDPVSDVKAVKDIFTDGDGHTEGTFQAFGAKEQLDSVQIRIYDTRKSDPSDIQPSEKNMGTDETVALKIDVQDDITPVAPLETLDEKREMQAAESLKKEGKHISWGNRIRMVGLFIVFIIMTQGYLWMYPDAGHQTVQWMCSKFPIIEQLLGVEKGEIDSVTHQVELVNVKQRFVSNESLGNIRVVEGAVVNQTDVPIAKIRVMGELFGSRGELLAARMSQCGNIVPDEILGSLKEEEIPSLSSFFQGGSMSNNKILPKSQIPFMIVFFREPAGVVKATVTAVGAEKISP